MQCLHIRRHGSPETVVEIAAQRRGDQLSPFPCAFPRYVDWETPVIGRPP